MDWVLHDDVRLIPYTCCTHTYIPPIPQSRIWDTRQGRQAAAMQQDDEALSCAIALQTGLLAVGAGCVHRQSIRDAIQVSYL